MYVCMYVCTYHMISHHIISFVSYDITSYSTVLHHSIYLRSLHVCMYVCTNHMISHHIISYQPLRPLYVFYHIMSYSHSICILSYHVICILSYHVIFTQYISSLSACMYVCMYKSYDITSYYIISAFSSSVCILSYHVIFYCTTSQYISSLSACMYVCMYVQII